MRRSPPKATGARGGWRTSLVTTQAQPGRSARWRSAIGTNCQRTDARARCTGKLVVPSEPGSARKPTWSTGSCWPSFPTVTTRTSPSAEPSSLPLRPRPRPLAPVLSEKADDAIRERTLRLAILNSVGLYDIAGIEAARLVDSADLDAKRTLLPELARLGAHGPALRTAVDLYHRNRLTEAELYAFLYPTAFSLLVARESAVSGIDPYLVYSLMKQESLFDPRAVSPAFAYGLMQLLPSTARRVSGNADIGGEDLFDPALNIRLGSAYLAELSRRFSGDAVFMLAGYNAGEAAADTWRTRYGKLDIDETIERITYRETRDYVKKVLANYRNYLRLYGGPLSGPGAEQSQQTSR